MFKKNFAHFRKAENLFRCDESRERENFPGENQSFFADICSKLNRGTIHNLGIYVGRLIKFFQDVYLTRKSLDRLQQRLIKNNNM